MRTRQTELVKQIVTPTKQDVGMHDSIRKGDFEPTNEESNGKSSDEEKNQLPTCGRNGDTKNLNEKKDKQ